jgi:hypothetical protein
MGLDDLSVFEQPQRITRSERDTPIDVHDEQFKETLETESQGGQPKNVASKSASKIF